MAVIRYWDHREARWVVWEPEESALPALDEVTVPAPRPEPQTTTRIGLPSSS
jgi:hypothetical protein